MYIVLKKRYRRLPVCRVEERATSGEFHASLKLASQPYAERHTLWDKRAVYQYIHLNTHSKRTIVSPPHPRLSLSLNPLAYLGTLTYFIRIRATTRSNTSVHSTTRIMSGLEKSLFNLKVSMRKLCGTFSFIPIYNSGDR